MSDPFNPEPKGAFTSILDWLDEPGQVVRNLIKGRPGASLRNLADFVLDPIDAVLPGDWIPSIAKAEDKVSGADLIDLDKQAHPFLGFAADVGLGILTDPLTYVPGGLVVQGAAKGAKAARTAIGALPAGAKVLEGVDQFGRAVRRLGGAQRVEPEARELVDQANALEGGVNAAGQAVVEDALKGVPRELRQDAFRVINNYRRDAAGKAIPLLDDAPLAATAADVARASLGGIEDAGRQVNPLRAGDAYMSVKPEGVRRVPGPLESSVGIEGVGVPTLAGDVLETVTKDPSRMWDQVFHPQYADAAAGRTFDQAVPGVLAEGRSASGIEAANAALRLPGHQAPPSLRNSAPLGPVERAPRPERMPAPGLDYLTGKGGPVAKAAEAGPEVATFDTVEGQLARWSNRVDALDRSPAYKEQLKAFLAKVAPMTQAQYRQAVEDFPAFARATGQDIAKESPRDYIQRAYTGITREGEQRMMGNPATLSERTLKDTESLVDFLNANPGVQIEEDIGRALLNRAQQQGRLARSSTIAKGVVESTAAKAQARQVAEATGGPAANLSAAEKTALGARFQTLSHGLGDAAEQVVNDLKQTDPETAQVLMDTMRGVAPRGAATAALARMNTFFKPYAVYGAFWPKFASIIRNVGGGDWNTVANPEARKAFGTLFKNNPKILAGAFNDGLQKLFGVRLRPSEFEEYEQALASSGGVFKNAIAKISDPTMRAAAETGVLTDGFVSAEKLLKEAERTGWRKRVGNWMEWPGAIFQGTEQRMRYTLFKSLMEDHGHAAKDAARIASDTFFNYRATSAENRVARDLVPFFQFSAKAVPQNAKFLAEKPAVAVGLSQAFGSNRSGEESTYPYLEDQLSIPLGRNDAGERLMAAGLGLPVEALGMLPNPSADLGDFGRQFEQAIVGSSQPLLKSAYGAVSGRDPYFGSPYGAYDELPVAGASGDLGRLYNQVAGAGVLGPVDQPLRQLDAWMDDRKPLGAKLVDQLSGARVVAVDADRALQLQLQEELARRPDVRRFESLASTGGDPETEALIEALRAARKRAKAKREAAQSGR